MEAMGYVYRHSPYKGAEFAIHLAIADSVNDQNHNTFWMSIAKLANKSRVSRKTASFAVSKIAVDGFLVLEKERPGGTNLYRFVFVDQPVVYESRTTPPGYSYPQPVTSGNTTRNATLHHPLPEVTPPVTSGSTNPIEPKKKPKEPLSSKSFDLEFDEFWAIYPRKEGKGVCKKKFDKIALKVDPQIIISAAHIYALRRKNEDPKYTAHPITWLNQERYLDEPNQPIEQKIVEQPKHPEPCTNPDCNNSWIMLPDNTVTKCQTCKGN